MAEKHTTSGVKKEGEVYRSERVSLTQQAEAVLKKAKAIAGDVILVPVNDRTTIELPAHLSPEEIEARVEKYIRLHKSTI